MGGGGGEAERKKERTNERKNARKRERKKGRVKPQYSVKGRKEGAEAEAVLRTGGKAGV